jgi:thiol-disulfide isomerase/thioredoxin
MNLPLLVGFWLGKLLLPDEPLPFNFEMKMMDDKYVMIISNATEEITCNDVSFKGDSMFVKVPVFDSEFRLKVDSNFMNGVWINHSRKGNPAIQFVAEINIKERFQHPTPSNKDVSGKWEAWFDIDSPDSSLAIGVLDQVGNKVTGTFLTETGDHRFLEGVVSGDSLKLSVFDGAHAWLYLAKINEDKLNGSFYSGAHYKAPFKAKKNPTVKLRDPNTITRVVGKLDFAFPDLDSTIVSLADARFKNKPVIIQILGSWCPNCLDETVFLNEFYIARRDEGVEVIALAFERNPDFNIAKSAVKRFVKNRNVEYPVLIAGVSGKQNVMKAMPQIHDFISFPTTIFLDRTGKVVKVHAGFSGPATGQAFEEFKKEFNRTMDRLIR